MSWSSNNVNIYFVVLAFKHVCLDQIMEDMSVFRYRLIMHDEQEYKAFVIWPRVHPNYGQKEKVYSKNFWCSCLRNFIDVKDTMQWALFLSSLISFWRPFFCTFALIWLQRKLAWTLFWQPFACRLAGLGQWLKTSKKLGSDHHLANSNIKFNNICWQIIRWIAPV